MENHHVIVKKILELFKPYPQVLAIYEGGSTAFWRNDNESDIDLYVITPSADDLRP